MTTPSQPPTSFASNSSAETAIGIKPPLGWLTFQVLDGESLLKPQAWLTEFLWIILIISVPFIFFQAYRQQQQLVANRNVDRARRGPFKNLWITPSWMAFFGLCDMYILGVLPLGPWRSAQHKSLTSWPEKRFLRRLIHMGIVPLYIQDGGIKRQQVQGLHCSRDFPYVRLPKYMQGKRRAYFEFLVPMAGNYSGPERAWMDPNSKPFRSFVTALLENNRGYRVSVSGELSNGAADCSDPPPDLDQPLEIGTVSSFKPLLPLKQNRIIQPSKGEAPQQLSDLMHIRLCRLFDRRKCPLVRVEVPHFGQRKLDEWVYGVAQSVGLDSVWNEGALHAHTSEWILDNGLEFDEYLIPIKDRV